VINWQIFQDHGIDEAKDRRVGADAKGKRQNSDGGEPGPERRARIA